MATQETGKKISLHSLPWRAAATWLLLTAVVLVLFSRQLRFEHDLDLGRRSTDRQIESVREALSGLLQQDLLRYDELDKQLQAISTTAVRQPRPMVKKQSSDLTANFAQKQEMEQQLSDVRTELRQDTAAKLAQLSSELKQTNSDLKQVVSRLDRTNAKVDSNSEELEQHSSPAAAPAPPPDQEQVTPHKKFWSKLNPFRKKPTGSDPNAVE
jgi:hypothetical protein